MPEQTQIPHVLWAQQRETVLITIAVPDIEKVDVKFEENSVSFHGQTASNGNQSATAYAVTLELFEKIVPNTCKYQNVGQKFWRLLLYKADAKAAFWPRLTKSKERLHWLQTDFNHWKDEDESDDEKPGFDGNFQNMFSGGGMGEMPGMEDDSDDEDDVAAELSPKPAAEEGKGDEENDQESKKDKIEVADGNSNAAASSGDQESTASEQKA